MNLHDETRSLVHKGHLKCVTLKRIHYFLFNDVLLLTKQQGDKHKLLFQIDLVDATMEAVIGDASAGSSFSLQFPFLSHLFLNFLSRFLFYFPNQLPFSYFDFNLSKFPFLCTSLLVLQYFWASLFWASPFWASLSFLFSPYSLLLHHFGIRREIWERKKINLFFSPIFF